MKSRNRRFNGLAVLGLLSLGLSAVSSLEAAVTIDPVTPPDGTVGTPYSFTFTAQERCDCEAPRFSWSYTGFLPGGLTLDANTGTLSGNPSGGGVYHANIVATDTANGGQQGAEAVAIKINGPLAKTSYVMNLNFNGNQVQVYQFITIPGGTTVNCGSDANNCGRGNVTDMAVDSSGNFVIVVNKAVDPAANSKIVRITPDGVVTVMNTDSTGLSNYSSIAIDSAGFYIVTDTSNVTPQVLRFANVPNSQGVPAGALPAGAVDAYVRIDPFGNYVVAQDGQAGIAMTRITPAGTTNLSFTSNGSPTALTGRVKGFTIDGNGNYVILETADGPTQVVSVTPAGAVSILFSNSDGTLGDPDGILFDPDINQFLITDDQNAALFSLTPDGDTLAQVPTGDGVGGNLLTVPLTVAAQIPAAAAPPPPPPPNVPPLQISGRSSLGDVAVGQSISDSFTVIGGTPPYSLTAGAAPAGVSLSGLTLSGAPTVPGNYNISINARDSGGGSAFFLVTVSVLGFNNTSLPAASAFIPYSASVQAAGGVAPYTYAGTGTPAGISVSQDGTVAGTATKTGTYSVAVTATDAAGVQATGAFSLVVSAPPALNVPGGTLAPATIQTSSSQVLSATGGSPPYSWAVVSGAIPDGMALQASGTLNGVPGTLGVFSFGAQVTDKSGGTATGTFSITVNRPPLTINAPSPLPSGMVSVDYPLQTLSASRGTPPYQFKVTSGSLPAGLSLSMTGAISGTPTAPGNSSFTVTASDSETPAATATANLAVTIRPYAADLLLSAGAVSFSLAAGSTALPSAEVVQIESTDTTQTLGYSAAISGLPSWLSIASASGTTPGAVSISLNKAALSLITLGSPYSASVVVTCMSGACNGKAQTIGISLVVTSTPPQLTLVNDSLAFSTLASAPQATTETLGISNTGGGSLSINSISCGASWCQPAGPAGAIGGGDSVTINVTADPTGLDPGYYYTSLSVHSSAGDASIPVTFQIAPNGTLTLDPAGEQFTLPKGGAAVGETSFLVTITGPAAVSFKAAVAPGAPWLSVTPSSGTASGTQPADLNIVFDQTQVAALSPGTYYATVQITLTGAVNSPQSFEVVLNITPPTAKTTPNLVPGGLLFLTKAGGNPPPQTIAIYSGSPNATPYQAAASTTSSGSWLSVSPSTGSTSSAAPGQATVTVTPGTLKPGVYTGTVNYSYTGAAVRSVNVTMIVEAVASATTGAGAISARDVPPAGPACTATRVVPTSTALVSNFAAPAAWPIEMAIQVVDDCGGPVANGQVVVTFSNGDPPMLLNTADPTKGLYDGTWTPRHSASQTTITARASVTGLAASSIQIAGAVTPNNAPVLLHNSTANFFNPIGGAPLAPGTLIQLSGQYLSSQSVTNATIPVPTTLGGTSVVIGGIPAPVTFVSPGQIDAQVPFELPAGQPYQVIVNANGALTTPDSFEAGATSPGLSVQTDGLVRANHQDGTAVSETAPAKPGEFISVYLVGLGATDVPVSSGTASPSSPIANVSNQPTATLNSEPVTFDFAGLSPGLVGVYQVNLQIPADAADGDLILSLSSVGATSNTGVLPVHK